MSDMGDEDDLERMALIIAGLVQGQILDLSAIPVLIPRHNALHPRASDVLRAAQGGTSALAAPIRIPSGLAMIVTQTCDLQPHRTLAGRALAHVAPVLELDGHLARDAARDTKPNYVPVPWLQGTYFADLDQIALIDRGMLAEASHGSAPSTEESRDLAYRLGRYFSRAAIPDNVVRALKPLQTIAESRHDAVQGVLASVSQVRLTSEPPFDASPPYRLRVILLVDGDAYPDAAPQPFRPTGADLHRIAEPLLEMLGRAEEAEMGQVVTLWTRVAEHMASRLSASLHRGNGDVADAEVVVMTALTADEFSNSDALDFGHLSLGEDS